MTMKPACVVCGANEIEEFIRIPQMPVHCCLLYKDRDSALQTPRGELDLGFCLTCHHIFNRAFQPGLMQYGQDYDNSLHFSPSFRDYARNLAYGLIKKYDLENKLVIDIGCGKGEFLKLLCEDGRNRGIGFDVSVEPGRAESQDKNITFIRDYYSAKYSRYQADLYCCRHVLEHVQHPRPFLSKIQDSIGRRPGVVVFFEVPNIMFTLKRSGVWDLIYEHSSYYSADSLGRLFHDRGFEIFHIAETFAGQFLIVEAGPGTDSAASPPEKRADSPEMTAYITSFRQALKDTLQVWGDAVDRIGRWRKRAVIWGAGAKGATFVNLLPLGGIIEYLVDINPHKEGKYIPGAGLRIVGPEFLADYRPEIIIVMNSVYMQEIREMTTRIGLSPEFLAA